MWGESSGVFEVFLLILSMCGVVLLAYISTKWLSKRVAPQSNTSAVKIIDRVFISQDKCFLIIKVVEKYMLVAVTSHSIQKICDISPEEMAVVLDANTKSQQSFNTIFEGTLDQIKSRFSKGGIGRDNDAGDSE